MAKLFATDMAQEVPLDSMRIHGWYGYAKDFPIERYYRDAHPDCTRPDQEVRNRRSRLDSKPLSSIATTGSSATRRSVTALKCNRFFGVPNSLIDMFECPEL